MGPRIDSNLGQPPYDWSRILVSGAGLQKIFFFFGGGGGWGVVVAESRC